MTTYVCRCCRSQVDARDFPPVMIDGRKFFPECGAFHKELKAEKGTSK